MNVIETELPGVLVIEPRVFGDERGFFMETWNERRYEEAGLPDRFVQDNLSYSSYGVLRGLHFQNPQPQGKLVSVLRGEVFDVAVDIRVGSPTFGKWTGATLSEENRRQFYVPADFAHGFVVTSETALFFYKCTNDPEIGIEWPTDAPILSERDRTAPPLRKMSAGSLPRYPAG